MTIRSACKAAFGGLFPVACAFAAPAAAQFPNEAEMAKWSDLSVVHYVVTGVVNDKHVQLPSDDADLYGDVVEKVSLEFDWDKNAMKFVGPVRITNFPAVVSNLTGMTPTCPAGELLGPYEHFDVLHAEPDGGGAIRLIGERRKPQTAVAESCGAGRRTYPAATLEVSEYIGPPDPIMLAMRGMMPADGPVKISADGKSLIMTALNNNWVWTYTPTAPAN